MGKQEVLVKKVNLKLQFFKVVISVALNICNGLNGFIQAGDDGYVIAPSQYSVSIESEHDLIKVTPIKQIEPYGKRKRRQVEEQRKDDSLTGDEDMFTWYDVDLDEEMAKHDELADLEWEGYVADKVWQVDLFLLVVKNIQYLILVGLSSS